MNADNDPVIELVRRGRAGDRAALRALFDRHVGAVHGYCGAFAGGDRRHARQLTEATFSEAFSTLSDLERPEDLGPWLGAVAREVCLRWHREHMAADRRKVAALTGPTRSGRVLAGLAAACPDPGVREVALRYHGDPPASIDRIASDLGIDTDTVSARITAYRQWARKQMLARLALGPEARS